MSWYEVAGLTSLARSALKEAQRTIDKALDIQEAEASLPTIEGLCTPTLLCLATSIRQGRPCSHDISGISGMVHLLS